MKKSDDAQEISDETQESTWKVVKYEFYICLAVIISITSFFVWTFAKG